jgi:hypothetical protein
MKKISVLFIGIFVIQLINAQKFHFVDTASTWHVLFSVYDEGRYSYSNETYFIRGDTFIHSINYKKFYRSGYAPLLNQVQATYIGGLREDSSTLRIYFLKDKLKGPNTCRSQFDTTEMLLYDFNLKPFDTIGDLNTNCYYEVEKIDSALIGDTYRKSIEFALIHNTDLTWIEGIGSIKGGPLYPILWVFEWNWDLLCYEYNSKVLYSNPNYSSCSLSVNKGYENNLYSISPNPFKDQIKIISSGNNQSWQELIIYDCLGKMIYNTKKYIKELTIDDITYDGLYILTIKNNDNIFVKKIIKISN